MMKLGKQIGKGDKRVLRGGSWINNGRNCRSAMRNRNTPDNRNNNIGFRLALAQNVLDNILMTRSFSCFIPLTAISKKQGHRYVSSQQECSDESLPDDRFCFNPVSHQLIQKS